MANATIKQKYASLLKKLFPNGWAWRAKRDPSSFFSLFLDSIADEFCRVEEAALKLLDEADPYTTFDLLEDWERKLGIPDDCSDPENLGTLQERRQRIAQKLTTLGGQNPAFYLLLAEQLGYDISIIDISDHGAFRAGVSRAGDALTNGAAWAFTFTVSAPADLIKYFRAGQSVAGDPLALFDNAVLRCVISKYKPAHTTVLFSFGA